MTYLYTLAVGKELYTCQTAAENFRSILAVVGGPEEKRRGE